MTQKRRGVGEGNKKKSQPPYVSPPYGGAASEQVVLSRGDALHVNLGAPLFLGGLVKKSHDVGAREPIDAVSVDRQNAIVNAQHATVAGRRGERQCVRSAARKGQAGRKPRGA